MPSLKVTIDASQAMAITEKLDKLLAQLDKTTAGFDKTVKSVEKSASRMSKVLDAVSNAVNKTTNAFKVLSSIASNVFKALTLGAGTVLVLTKYLKESLDAVMRFINGLNTAQTELDKFRFTMAVAAGTISGANKEMNFLVATSRKLGADLSALVTPYAKLAAAAKGTNIEGKATRELFEAISKASVALHFDLQDTQFSMFALQQMVSKGKVSMEELRRQLGERLPGAVALGAQAMKMSMDEFEKALKKGEILSEAFLPNFTKVLEARFGAAAELAAEGMKAQFNNLNTALFETKKAFLDASDYGFNMGQILKSIVSIIDESRDAVSLLGEAFGDLLEKASLTISTMLSADFLGGLAATIKETYFYTQDVSKALDDLDGSSLNVVDRTFINILSSVSSIPLQIELAKLYTSQLVLETKEYFSWLIQTGQVLSDVTGFLYSVSGAELLVNSVGKAFNYLGGEVTDVTKEIDAQIRANNKDILVTEAKIDALEKVIELQFKRNKAAKDANRDELQTNKALFKSMDSLKNKAEEISQVHFEAVRQYLQGAGKQETVDKTRLQSLNKLNTIYKGLELSIKGWSAAQNTEEGQKQLKALNEVLEAVRLMMIQVKGTAAELNDDIAKSAAEALEKQTDLYNSLFPAEKKYAKQLETINELRKEGNTLTDEQKNKLIELENQIAKNKQCDAIKDNLDCIEELRLEFDDVARATHDFEQAQKKLNLAMKEGGLSSDIAFKKLNKLRKEIVKAKADAGDLGAKFSLILEDFNEDVDKHISGFLSDALKGEEDAWDNFTDRLKNSWAEMLADMIMTAATNAITVNFAGSLTGGSGGSIMGALTGQGGGVGATDLLSAGKTLWEGFSTASGAFGAFGTGAIGGAITPVINSLVADWGIGQFATNAMGPTLSGASLGAGSGFLGSVGTAMPYIGAALMVANLLGVFDSDSDVTPDLNLRANFGEDRFGAFTFQDGEAMGTAKSIFGNISYGTQHDAFANEQDAREFADNLAASFQPFDQLIASAVGEEMTDNIIAGMKDVDEYIKVEEGEEFAGAMKTIFKNRFTRISDIIGGEFDEIFDMFADDYSQGVTAASAYITATDEVKDMLMSFWTDQKEAVEEVMNEGENVVTTSLRLVNQIAAVNGQFELLGISSYEFTTQSAFLANTLIETAGGMEALTAKTNFYYENFFDENEKAKHVLKNTSDAIAEFNEKFGLNITDKAGIRAAIEDENLDKTTEAGIELYNALLNLAPVMVANTQAAEFLATSHPLYQESLKVKESLVTEEEKHLELMNGYKTMFDDRLITESEYLEIVKQSNPLYRDSIKLIDSLTTSEEKRLVVWANYDKMLKDNLITEEQHAQAVRELNPLYQDSISLIDSLITDEEKRNALISDYMTMVAAGLITQEQFTQAVKNANAATEEELKAKEEAAEVFTKSMRELSFVLDRESVLDNTIRTINELMDEFGLIGDHASYSTQDLSKLVRTLDGMDEATLNAESGIHDLAYAMMELEDIIADAQNTVDSILGDRALSALDDQIAAERTRLDLAQQLHDAEMERYENAIASNATIMGFLNELSISDLAPQSGLQQLQQAGALFNQAIASGDADKATQFGRDYLEFAQKYYSASSEYGDIYSQVTGSLEGMLSSVGVPTSAGVDTTVLTDLEQQKADYENSLRQDSLEQQNLQLIEALNTMALAKDESLFSIAAQNGVDLKDLGYSLIGSLETLNEATIDQMIDWAKENKVTSTELANTAGMDYAQMILYLSRADILLKDIREWDKSIAGYTDLTYEKIIEIAKDQLWSTQTLADKYGTTNDKVIDYLTEHGYSLESINAWNEKVSKESVNSTNFLKSIDQSLIDVNRQTYEAAQAAGFGGQYTDNQLLQYMAIDQMNALISATLGISTMPLSSWINRVTPASTPVLNFTNPEQKDNADIVAELQEINARLASIENINASGFNGNKAELTRIADAQEDIADEERLAE